jgi:periplasmic mercuric ion binding protein
MKVMIKYFSLVLVLFLAVFTAENSIASGKKEKATIKTSAACEMCKKKIESGVKKLDGIEKATLALGKNELKVQFQPEKITLEQIKKTIASLGYDADGVKADAEAYQKLPKCCKLDSKEKSKK